MIIGHPGNDPALGRSVSETLRMLDALRFYGENAWLCPADHQEGDKGVKASTEGTVDYLFRFAKKKNESK